jgi:hypothetical protein
MDTHTPPNLTPHIAAAIASMQAAGLVCVKERQNKLLKSNYATLADIWEVLRPHLTAHGLIVQFRHGEMKSIGSQFVQSITTRVMHAASQEMEEWTADFPLPEGNAGVSFAQRFGSATTYAQKYALCAYFGILTGDDDDARRAAAQAGGEREARPSANPEAWPAFLDGGWNDACSPADDSVALADITHKERVALWKKFPAYGPLIGYVGDLITSRLEQEGIGWNPWTVRTGGEWPETLEACTPEQVGAAARIILAPRQPAA